MLKAINQSISHFIKQRFDRWLAKRMPAKKRFTLSNRNIFIFPSKFGLVYIGFILLIFLLGTNYQNNLILLFAYLLASLFITAMLHSFYNLSGVTIESVGEIKGYANSQINALFKLNSQSQGYQFSFNFNGQKPTVYAGLNTQQQIEVKINNLPRGKLPLGRLTIASDHVLGLFRTWTHLDFDATAIVYPMPKAIVGRYQPSDAQSTSDEINDKQQSAQRGQGNEDFYALDRYQKGQPLAHVAWKQVARGRGWYSKLYQSEPSGDLMLSLASMPAGDIETKLSMLCYLVQEYHQKSLTFGLELGKQVIAPSVGNGHFEQCLLALASFGSTNTVQATSQKIAEDNINEALK